MHRTAAVVLGVLGIVAIFATTQLVAAFVVAAGVWFVFDMPGPKTRTVHKIEVREIPVSEPFINTIRTFVAAQNQVNKQLRLIQRPNGSLWLGHGQGRSTVVTHQVLPDEAHIILIGDDEVRDEAVA